MLARIFRTIYKDIVDIIHLTQVQNIKDGEGYFKQIDTVLKNADIIITQNINAPSKDPFLKIFPKNEHAMVIFIDSLFVSYFHPELIKTNMIPEFKVGWLHDINIINAIVEKRSLQYFLNNDPFYDENFYSNDVYEREYLKTIEEFKKRTNKLSKRILQLNRQKKPLHISILPYIKSTFKQEYTIPLWGDHNHPNLPVFEYLMQELISLLELPDREKLFKSSFDVDSFQYIKRPIYKSTVKYLNIKNRSKNNYYNLGHDYQNIIREKFVKDIWSFYLRLDKSKLEIILKEAKKPNLLP